MVSLTETIEPINLKLSVRPRPFDFFFLKDTSEDKKKGKWDVLCHLVMKL